MATTGGSPLGPIFDLNKDGSLGSADLAVNGKIPIAKFLGSGIFSQPRLIRADGFTTTLFVFHPDLPLDVPAPPDPGVSGGHFDYDIFYYTNIEEVTEDVPTGEFEIVQNVCAVTKDLSKDLDTNTTYCTDNASATTYSFMSNYITGSACATKDSNYHDVTCNEIETVTFTTGDFKKIKHTHEYDDDFNVTGVNMLNASDPVYNLVDAIPDDSVQFKVLILNQYLNPAVEVAIGGPFFVNVKDYAGQTRQQMLRQCWRARLLSVGPRWPTSYLTCRWMLSPIKIGGAMVVCFVPA